MMPENENGGGAPTPFAPALALSESSKRAGDSTRRANAKAVIFVADSGQRFIRTGKGGRVLSMLARMRGGVTQWDTLPWHTRLSSTVHALRREGLAIVTEIEGPFRHARYRLATAGQLVEPNP